MARRLSIEILHSGLFGIFPSHVLQQRYIVRYIGTQELEARTTACVIQMMKKILLEIPISKVTKYFRLCTTHCYFL